MSDAITTVKTNTLALVGFIAAFVIPLVGLILGILARRQLSVPGNLEGGRGLALAAVVIGIVGVLAQAAFFAVWLWFFTSILNAGGFLT